MMVCLFSMQFSTMLVRRFRDSTRHSTLSQEELISWQLTAVGWGSPAPPPCTSAALPRCPDYQGIATPWYWVIIEPLKGFCPQACRHFIKGRCPSLPMWVPSPAAVWCAWYKQSTPVPDSRNNHFISSAKCHPKLQRWAVRFFKSLNRWYLTHEGGRGQSIGCVKDWLWSRDRCTSEGGRGNYQPMCYFCGLINALNYISMCGLYCVIILRS
jgi:hypothetical protein